MSFVCSKCNSSGVIVATHRTKGGLFAFSCDCTLGDKHKHYSKWLMVHQKTYKADYIHEPKPDIKTIASNMADKEIDDCPF